MQPDDFIDCMRDGPQNLIIEGDWSDNTGSCQERIQIDCRLVSAEVSGSLLMSLASRKWVDERDLIFESSLDVEQLPSVFLLKRVSESDGWDSGIDEADPRGDGISNYFGQLDGELIRALALQESVPPKTLVSEEDSKIWFEFERWNEEIPSGHREFSRRGQRLKASAEAVNAMLEKLGMDLAITVSIYREKQEFGEKSYGDYARPYSKHFILSSDGRIRDFRNNYQLW